MKIHASGNFIAWPHVAMRAKPDIELLWLYKNEERATQAVNAYVCCRPILPMKVLFSPLLAIILDDREQQWKTRYSHTLNIVIVMQQILRCYTTVESIPFYRENKELCERVWAKVKKETDALEHALLTDVEAQLDDVAYFRERIRRHTIAYINLLEGCLYELFQPEVPLKACLTPYVDPNEIALDEDAEKDFQRFFKIFFYAKQRFAEMRVFTFRRSIFKDYLEFFRLEADKK